MNQKDRKRLRNACDKLWADITKIIHIRKHGRICLWCKKMTDKLQSDHVFNRWKTATRWNPSNCVVLCAPCHLFRKKREPILWAEIAKAELTDDVYEELKIVSQQECKPDYLTIKMWLEGLKRTLTKPETEGIV